MNFGNLKKITPGRSRPTLTNASKSDFRPPDERAIRLTAYLLDSIQNIKKIHAGGHQEDDLVFRNQQPFLDEIFSEEGNEYLHLPDLFSLGRNADVKRALGFSLAEIAKYPAIRVVDEIDVKKYGVWRTNEWYYQTVVMSLPTYLDWAEPINAGKPDRFLAVMQHIFFIHKLITFGSRILLITPKENCPAGVFTRDVLVAIDDKVLRSSMLQPVRQPEQELVKNADYIPPPEIKIEWGDLFLDKSNQVILLGIGARTNMLGADWLQSIVGTGYEVIPLPTKEGILHLDCAFSLVGKLLYSDALENEEHIGLLKKIYGPLKLLTKKQADALLSNLISVCNRILPRSNYLLASPSLIPLHLSGSPAIAPINLSEVIKVDGAHRCTTAPLK